MIDLLASVPLPVWVIAAAATIPVGVITWFATASRCAPMDTSLWEGGAPDGVLDELPAMYTAKER